MAATPGSSFGVRLRRLRDEAGLSLGDFAALTHYSKGHLSKVETGRKPPSADLARRCDAALGAKGALSALVSLTAGTTSTVASADRTEDGENWMLDWNRSGDGTFTTVSRRHVLGAGAGAVVAWNVGWPTPAPVADDAAAPFRAVFAGLRQLGRVASPAVVLPMVVAQLAALRSLARDTGRADLIRLAARCAEYAGWMAQELGDDRAALRWVDMAVDLADTVGDVELRQYALVRRAGVMLYRGDAGQTVALSRQAGTIHGRTTARVTGLAARREAQGHALAGDVDACLRALDRSAEQLGRAPDTDRAVVLGSATALDQHALTTAWCLYDLGRTAAASDLFHAALATAPPTRASARFRVRHVLALAACREIDEACAVTRHILDRVGAVDSATIRAELRTVGRALGRWHSHPAVRELRPALEDAYRDR